MNSSSSRKMGYVPGFRVSVVTPSYNQARFIGRTLASVASQGVPLEHVVMDGGSKDDTVEILRAAGDSIRWTSEPDGGQAAAVNKGFRATSGEIVGWLNSDDVYYPGAIARVVEYLDAHPDVDVVYGDADHIDVDDAVMEPYPTRPWNAAGLERVCFICQPALFMRRRVLQRHGLLDESLRYCMDYEYWLRLAQAGARFAHLPVKLAGSRLHADTKTLGSRIPVHEEINDMLLRTLGYVPPTWLGAYAYAVADGKGGPAWTRRMRALGPYIEARRRWG